MNEKNFGYLGTSFQQGLLKTIIEDKRFAVSIIDVVDSKYFDGPYFRYLMENIKEIYKVYGVIPTYDTLEQKVLKENRDSSVSRIHIDTLRTIQELEISNSGWIKDVSLNFCRQQVLKSSLKKVEEIMSNGEFEQYGKIEEIIQKALQVGIVTDDVRDVCASVRDALQPNSRVSYPTGIQGIDELLKGGLGKGELGIILAPTGVGKSQPISERILTPTGWKIMGEVEVGDEVMGSDGNPQSVLGVYPQGVRPIYKVEFTDGTVVDCDLDHLWTISRSNGGKWETITTSQIISEMNDDDSVKFYLPIVEPVRFNGRPTLSDPYVRGYQLSDVYLFENGVNVVNKFIPDDYIYNTLDVRVSLIQGIMDADGMVTDDGACRVSTRSINFLMNLREIVLSLGGSVKVIPCDENDVEITFCLIFSFNNNIVPFRLEDKVKKYVELRVKNQEKCIETITYSRNEASVCIKVSNSDELYVTNNYVLTHNTTILTKIANSAFNDGANVLQIFFEDNVNDILRKHYAIWTGYRPDEQPEHEEEIVTIVETVGNRKNEIKLLKLPSFGVSVSDIKSRLRKLEFEGFKTDLLIIDYVDCISSERKIEGDEWKGEGAIMRSLESMTDEFNIALWTATQGSRDSISSEVVTTDQMGGSIKKAQIGHVVISIGKTLEQKEHNLGTITLLKSRIGKDGIIFQNCMFDNEYLQIDTDSQNTLLGHQEEQAEKKQQRAAEVYRKSLETRSRIKSEVDSKKHQSVEKPPAEEEKLIDPLVAIGHQLSDFESSRIRAVKAYRESKKTEKGDKNVLEGVNKLNN